MMAFHVLNKSIPSDNLAVTDKEQVVCYAVLGKMQMLAAWFLTYFTVNNIDTNAYTKKNPTGKAHWYIFLAQG